MAAMIPARVISTALHEQSMLGLRRRRRRQASRHLDRAIALVDAAEGPFTAELVWLLADLGVVQSRRHRPARAKKSLLYALAAHLAAHPGMAGLPTLLAMLAIALRRGGRIRDGVLLYERALRLATTLPEIGEHERASVRWLGQQVWRSLDPHGNARRNRQAADVINRRHEGDWDARRAIRAAAVGRWGSVSARLNPYLSGLLLMAMAVAWTLMWRLPGLSFIDPTELEVLRRCLAGVTIGVLGVIAVQVVWLVKAKAMRRALPAAARPMTRDDIAALIVDEWGRSPRAQRTAPGRRMSAYCLWLVGRRADAVVELDRLVTDLPADGLARRDRGIARLETGEPDLARTDLEDAVALGEVGAATFAFLADAHRLLGDPAEAIRTAGCALEADPGCVAALRVRGTALLALDRYEEAATDLDRACQLGVMDTFVLYHRGEARRLLGRYASAEADFDSVLETAPRAWDAWESRGACRRALGRFAEAAADFDRAVRLKPGSCFALFQQGMNYLDLDRADLAIPVFDHLLKLDGTDPSAWIGRGIARHRRGRYAAALADFDGALAADSHCAEAWARRGTALRHLGRHDEAECSYGHAITLDPQDAYARRGRGTARVVLGDRAGGLQDLQEAVALDPENVFGLFQRSEALRLLGRHEDAIAGYDRLLELRSDHIGALIGRGHCRRMIGRFAKAVDDYDAALRRDGRRAAAWAGRADAQHHLGRPEQAAADFARALRLDVAQDLDPWLSETPK